MKKLTLTILTGVLLAGGAAKADYQCTDYNNEVSMSIKENHITHLGNTSIQLVSASKKSQLFGTIHSEGGVLLKKKVIDIFPFKGDTLTIVSKPKSCGRGSCDFNASPVFTAKLKIGEALTFFSCNETNL